MDRRTHDAFRTAIANIRAQIVDNDPELSVTTKYLFSSIEDAAMGYEALCGALCNLLETACNVDLDKTLENLALVAAEK